MIIYNVTVNIDHSVHDEWLQWMKEVHIPAVMNTGKFIECRMLKVLADEESGGTTYSTQYTCRTMEEYREYEMGYAEALRAEANEKFKNKFVVFRTLLETVDM